ncbi:MAG: hypothetical protein ACUVUC_08910 [Thermoguttaceae bacterium]
MGPLFETITDLAKGRQSLQRRRYGIIEARDGSFYRVRLRPFPKITTGLEIALLGTWYHRYRPGDRCLLYYNQPRRFPNFLALKYFVSARDTRVSTVRRVLETLDEIARLKRIDALLCDAANWRLSTAIMVRLGWEPHCPSRWHRFFIRRFYGNYPSPAGWLPGQLSQSGTV